VTWRSVENRVPFMVTAGSAGVVPLQRLLVGGGLISKQRSEVFTAVSAEGKQFAVVVADLVPEVTEHRAVGLVHALPQRFAMGVVALGKVKGDDAVLMAGDDLAVTAGEQIERQSL